ncbi:MAG: hypothetical protein P1V81_15125 [Planctomycetota bacterium]|nr:hypothetical protein [Planctomycetota bacterium]
MIFFRVLAMLLFVAIAASYGADVVGSLEHGSVNHLQVGVLVVSVYCLLAVLAQDARDTLLKKILRELQASEE